MLEAFPLKFLDACALGEKLLISLEKADGKGNRAALRLADAAGERVPMTLLGPPGEPLRSVAVAGNAIWGIGDSGRVWSNAPHLQRVRGWTRVPTFRLAFALRQPDRWFAYTLPEDAAPVSLAVAPGAEWLRVGTGAGEILRLDVLRDELVHEATLASANGETPGIPYSMVADASGRIVVFGTADAPMRLTPSGCEMISVIGLPERPRFVRARRRSDKGCILACTSDRFVLEGSSEGFEVVAHLDEEPFDVADYRGRRYAATMAGVLDLEGAAPPPPGPDNVSAVCLVPTDNALYAIDIEAWAKGSGEIAFWIGDVGLGAAGRLRLQAPAPTRPGSAEG